MKENKPQHYKTNIDFDVIDLCQNYSIPFTLGNVIKYLCRAGKKENESELKDLNKSLVYINREIDFLINIDNEENFNIDIELNKYYGTKIPYEVHKYNEVDLLNQYNININKVTAILKIIEFTQLNKNNMDVTMDDVLRPLLLARQSIEILIKQIEDSIIINSSNEGSLEELTEFPEATKEIDKKIINSLKYEASCISLFYQLKKILLKETMYISNYNSNQIINNNTFKKIIDLGKNDKKILLPLIIDELKNETSIFWIDVLTNITGVDPVKIRNKGVFEEMKNDWIEYYENIYNINDETVDSFIQPASNFRFSG